MKDVHARLVKLRQINLHEDNERTIKDFLGIQVLYSGILYE